MIENLLVVLLWSGCSADGGEVGVVEYLAILLDAMSVQAIAGVVPPRTVEVGAVIRHLSTLERRAGCKHTTVLCYGQCLG